MGVGDAMMTALVTSVVTVIAIPQVLSMIKTSQADPAATRVRPSAAESVVVVIPSAEIGLVKKLSTDRRE